MEIEGKFKRMFSYFWCGLRRAFSYKMVLRGIQRCFLRGGAQNVLFWGQDSEEFSGILYSVVKKVTFLKGNLLCINVLQTFYKFCHWCQRKISNYIRICDRFCIEICIVFIRLTSESSNNKIFKNNFSVYCFRGTQRLFSVKYLFGEAKIA